MAWGGGVFSLHLYCIRHSVIPNWGNPYMFPIKEQEMFDGKKTGLSAKLNINGYFVDEIYINRYGEDNREWNNLIFLEDGTYTRLFLDKEHWDIIIM